MKGRGAIAIALLLFVGAGVKPQDRFKTLLEPVIKDVMAQADMPGFAVELKKNQPQTYDFQERHLNNLGYNFLNQGKFKEAIRVFQLNVEAYPNSSNVYDSLGEAYMKNGEKAPAIENYEKSLKLDPGNTGAVEALKKLRAQ